MPLPPSSSAKRGFTLVELMVAIAVLSILVYVVAKIVSGAATITTFSNTHVDANSQARLVFDRLALDLSRMLKRPDADVIFCKNYSAASGYNDTLFFFSESSGAYDTTTSTNWSAERNNISLVGYRINNNSTGPNYGQLERLGKALPWDTTAASGSAFPMVYLTYPPAGTSPTGTTYSTADFASTIYGAFSSGSVNSIGTLGNSFTDSTDPDYHVLGNQIFRFELSYILKDGTQSTLPVIQSTPSQPSVANSLNTVPSFVSMSGPPTYSDGYPNYSVGSRWYDSANQIAYICTSAPYDPVSQSAASPPAAVWKQLGTQDITAIVVTIATLDSSSRYFLQKSGNATALASLAAKFLKWPSGTIPTTTTNLTTTWSNAITTTGNLTGVLPQSMASRIRVYQRAFYLDTP